MGTQVSWMLELEIQPGRENDFRALMQEMIAATKSNEPGALSYEWSVSADGRACHIYECYADSDAVMAHLANFGANFAVRFFAALKPARFTVYGAPNDAVRQALAPFGAIHLQPAGGFRR